MTTAHDMSLIQLDLSTNKTVKIAFELTESRERQTVGADETISLVLPGKARATAPLYQPLPALRESYPKH